MVPDYLATLIKSWKSQPRLKFLRLPLGACALSIIIGLGWYLVDDQVSNQDDDHESKGQSVKLIYEQDNTAKDNILTSASSKPPRAISWSSPLRKQCSGIDPNILLRLNLLQKKLINDRKDWPIHESNYGKRHHWDIYGRRLNTSPRLVILHETSGSLTSAYNTFKDNHPKDEWQVSYHTMISLDGKVADLVDPHLRAYGAGNSAFLGEWAVTNPRLTGSVNNFALHLSLETPWDGRHLGPSHSGYTQAQYDSLALVLSQWMNRFSIPAQNITTHQHVDLAGERSDPRSFSWKDLQIRLAALDHLCTRKGKLDKGKFR